MANVLAVYATVIHTGTRAVRAVLAPGVDRIVDVHDFKPERMAGNILLHAHIEESVEPALRDLVQQYPLIYTLRDPLKALASTMSRGDLDGVAEMGAALTEHFRILMRLVAAAPVSYPIRLVKDPTSDVNAVRLALGLYGSPYPLVPIGGGAPSALKTAAAAGDVAYIQRSIPDAYAALKAAEPELRPWLEERGLRGLAWYD